MIIIVWQTLQAMQAIQKLRSWWKGDQPGAEAENQYGLSCIVEGVDPVVEYVLDV
jgi:hypothetical protein